MSFFFSATDGRGKTRDGDGDTAPSVKLGPPTICRGEEWGAVRIACGSPLGCEKWEA